jgi:hypothetical protein
MTIVISTNTGSPDYNVVKHFEGGSENYSHLNQAEVVALISKLFEQKDKK